MAHPEADEAGLHHQGQQFLNRRRGGEEHRGGAGSLEGTREEWRSSGTEGAAAAGDSGANFRLLRDSLQVVSRGSHGARVGDLKTLRREIRLVLRFDSIRKGDCGHLVCQVAERLPVAVLVHHFCFS